MSLSTEQIGQIAQLARLEVSPDQTELYSRQLTDILAMVDQLGDAETEGIVPMAHPLGMTQRLRDDAVSETDQRDAFQRIAPAVDAGLYLVPKVIE